MASQSARIKHRNKLKVSGRPVDLAVYTEPTEKKRTKSETKAEIKRYSTDIPRYCGHTGTFYL